MTNDKLEELYKKYHLFVKDVAYKILGDAYLAQDICHDVFLKLSDEWIEAEMDSAVRLEFLRVAAFHKALDYKSDRWASYLDVPYEQVLEDKEKYKYLVTDMGLDDKVLGKVFVYQMLQKLKAINEQWYEVLLRKEIYLQPVSLIAKDLRMTIPSVYVTLHRAKTWVKEKYEKLYKEFF